MDELRRLWREHLEAAYPDGYSDKDVAGVALILPGTLTSPAVYPPPSEALDASTLSVRHSLSAVTGTSLGSHES